MNRGGVAIIPCDTIYGFVGRVPDSRDRILEIKGRAENNPFLQLSRDVEAVIRIAATQFPPELTSLWPGPVTMIFDDYRGESLAVRVPDDPFLTQLLKELDYFIYSTSVNKSGQPPMGEIQKIIKLFENEVNLIVDGGDLFEGKASTLLDIRERPVKILRQGAAVIPETLFNLS